MYIFNVHKQNKSFYRYNPSFKHTSTHIYDIKLMGTGEINKQSL